MLNHKQLEAIIELIDDKTIYFEVSDETNQVTYTKGAWMEVYYGEKSFTTLSAFIDWVREGNHCVKVDYFVYNRDEEFNPEDEPFVSYPERRDMLPDIAFDTCNLIAFENHYDLYTYRRIRYTIDGKTREYEALSGDTTFEPVKE